VTAVTRRRKAPAIPLAGIVKTVFAPRITRTGLTRPECWGARTTDGIWAFDREDEPGTPWTVTSLPARIVVTTYMPSLRACRVYVANGGAAADLERIEAHERGEHKAERDTSCVKC
jgi:hypothetical protein